MPHYLPHQVADPDLAPCPIAGLAVDSQEHDSGWHQHTRTQLLYQIQGRLTVQLRDRIGQLAPLQALWLPAGVEHSCRMVGAFAYRSVYFDPTVYPTLPTHALIIDINPLLRELIVRVCTWSAEQALNTEQNHVVSTLLDELQSAPRHTLSLPTPQDPRLQRIAQALLDEPSLALSLAEWGAQVGASARTLSRAFIRETGLSFAEWRTQSRLLSAHTCLVTGMSVTEVAHRLGYASDSAFIAMYRRVYGTPPGRRNRKNSAQ